MNWTFPLREWKGEIPKTGHPGAFGAVRKHDIHTGVDLYVPESCLVHAVESGIIVAVENFTGPEAGSPWWLPTKAFLVEGETGVICYGEIEPIDLLENRVGDFVEKGQCMGVISPVLPEEKEPLDIPGHSRFMLHFELYKHGTKETVWWHTNQKQPLNLLNPTDLLISSFEQNEHV